MTLEELKAIGDSDPDKAMEMLNSGEVKIANYMVGVAFGPEETDAATLKDFKTSLLYRLEEIITEVAETEFRIERKDDQMFVTSDSMELNHMADMANTVMVVVPETVSQDINDPFDEKPIFMPGQKKGEA